MRTTNSLGQIGMALPDGLTDAHMEWMADGACRHSSASTDLFFPGKGQSHLIWKARILCYGCPVRERCRDWAIVNDITDGIWGGLQGIERYEFKRGNHDGNISETNRNDDLRRSEKALVSRWA